MKGLFKLSKLFLVLALLPASASAATITISAPSDSSTTATISGTGSANIQLLTGPYTLRFNGIGDYNLFDNGRFSVNGSFSINSIPVKVLEERGGTDFGSDDFVIGVEQFPGLSAGSITFSGSSTFDLTSQHGRYVDTTFADFEIGTYNLHYSDFSGAFTDGPHTLVIEYSSVPDTGSTAALLGAGVVALAFARRRLG